MLVSHAALAAARRNPLLARLREVGEDAPVGILHDGASRDIDDEVFGATPGAALRSTRLAALRLVHACVAHVEERGVLLVHLQDHVTAATAVAAVRASERHELFAMETADAVTALAGANFN